MKTCQCSKCKCTNQVKEFGHRYEEENAIVEAEYEHNADKVKSIIQKICTLCEKGQHPGFPK